MKPSKQSAWPMRILQISIILHYFGNGIGKTFYGNWLSNPYVIFSFVQGYFRTDFAAWALQEWPLIIWVVMKWVVLTFQLLAPIIFTIKFTRIYALMIGLTFHILIALMMDQVVYFSLVMLCYYVLFVKVETLQNYRNLFLKFFQSR